MSPFYKKATLRLVLWGWVLTGITCSADVKLPHLISDGMVLQRGRPVNFWGTADPGESVSVSFQRQTATVVAGNDGRWMVSLGPLQSGGPYTLAVTGKNAIKVFCEIAEIDPR